MLDIINNLIPLLFLLFYCIFSISPSSITTSLAAEVGVADQLKEMRSVINQLNRKTGLLEHKNIRQDGELRYLKTVLSNIVASNQNDDEIVNVAMQKRPARLLPIRLFRGDKEVEPIVGPPSSCKDLSQLGHTLNGIYLTRINSKSSNNSKIINAVFCDFQPNPGAQKQPTIIENRLGYVDVKSAASAIYFHVQIGNRSSFPANGVLPYDHQVSNTGGGMNLKTGVFTAPKAGVYTFSFSMTKNGWIYEFSEIALRLNGVRVGQSMTGRGLFTAVVSLQTTLKLKKGDRIDLWKSHGELHQECKIYCHHFTGSLIEEDLVEFTTQ